ncbi:MAG: hypothetical protein JW932_14930 [Deltaproteobacteria bacterium]|nr:hypothetical protein [Deltaproteobacteria bacterium]
MNEAIIEQVRHAVHELEPTAEIIPNHTRPREETRMETDWDVLVQVDGPMDDRHVDRIRNRIYEIEWQTGEVVSVIIQSRGGSIGNLQQTISSRKRSSQGGGDPDTMDRTATASDAVTIEVLNPRGDIKPPPLLVPTPRVTDLAGKTIGIYWIGKQGGNNFFEVMNEMLHQEYPETKTNRYVGKFNVPDEQAATIAKECDAVIYGVGD